MKYRSHDNHLDHKKARSEDGFTLVEVLAALTIFAIVGLATFTLMQRALTSKTVSKRKAEKLRETQQALSLLKDDLSSTQTYALLPFQGYADSLRFTAFTTTEDGAVLACSIAYSVKGDPDSKYKRLVRSVLDFEGHRDRATVMQEVESMQIHYLADQNDPEAWQNHWLDAGYLPLAVRIRIFQPAIQNPLEVICPIRTHAEIKTQNVEHDASSQ